MPFSMKDYKEFCDFIAPKEPHVRVFSMILSKVF